jgi:hypothetical protein
LPGVQFDVFHNTLTVSTLRRMQIALRIWLRSRFNR